MTRPGFGPAGRHVTDLQGQWWQPLVLKDVEALVHLLRRPWEERVRCERQADRSLKILHEGL